MTGVHSVPWQHVPRTAEHTGDFSSDWETTDDDAVDEVPDQADEGTRRLDKIPRKIEAQDSTEDTNATAKRRRVEGTHSGTTSQVVRLLRPLRREECPSPLHFEAGTLTLPPVTKGQLTLHSNITSCTVRTAYTSKRCSNMNIWIRDVVLLFLSDPTTFGAVGPNQNTCRIEIL